MEAGMSVPVALRDAPSLFLDPGKWAELRSFARNDLIALTYINAPYPDKSDLFRREGSFEEALRCYELGRALLHECRLLFVQRKLIATLPAPDGKRVKIPGIAWINLWPLFATGRANGPGIIFNEIEIYETHQRKLERTCLAWLISRTDLPTHKKHTIYQEAKLALGKKLSHAIFNAAYKRALGRKRGRPPTVQLKK
jgi:hypothetical protein